MKKIPQTHFFNKAFTMLELVFVIIVIGILSTFLLQETKRNMAYEAATQLVSHIRYTQHLAMVDDRFAAGDNGWFKERWTIIFNNALYTNNKQAYTLFSDGQAGNAGNPDIAEIANNPQDLSRLMTGGATGSDIRLDIREDTFIGMKELNLGEKFDIEDLVLSSACSFSGSKRISFDHLGRPLKGNLSSYSEAYENHRLITDQCTITLTDADGEEAVIAIEPETGYVHILN